MKSLSDLSYGDLQGFQRAAGEHWTIQRTIEKHYRDELQKKQVELWAMHKADLDKRRKAAERRGDKKPIVDRGPDPSTWPVRKQRAQSFATHFYFLFLFGSYWFRRLQIVSKKMPIFSLHSERSSCPSRLTLRLRRTRRCSAVRPLPWAISKVAKSAALVLYTYFAIVAFLFEIAILLSFNLAYCFDCFFLKKNIARLKKRLQELSKSGKALFDKASTSFHARFREKFNSAVASSSPSGTYVGAVASALGLSSGGANAKQDKLRVAEAAFSNLLGGHGYWYGSSILYTGESEVRRFSYGAFYIDFLIFFFEKQTTHKRTLD